MTGPKLTVVLLATRLLLLLAVLVCCCAPNKNAASAFSSPSLVSFHPATTSSTRRVLLSMAAAPGTTEETRAAAAFAPPTTTTTTSLSSSIDATNEYLYIPQQEADKEEEEAHDFFNFDLPNVNDASISNSIWTNLQKSGVSLDDPSLSFARGLILLASAVYGTNFAMVKMLDEQVPFAVSAALRFCLAATAVTTLVLRGEQQQQMQQALVDDKVLVEQRQERWAATLAGCEIGAWYCLGYLCQSMGLQTADASKVRFPNTVM